ncbi:MAG TPA: hypothetical protein VNO30_49675 [Kofleriaceae bacterium]|nr:hypothetical protein [Kofleriaceae bacterium]
MLVDAVDACTTMLAATASLDRRRAEADAVLQAIGEQERQLLLFERAVAAACIPGPHGGDTPAARAAELTRSAMQGAVERSREQLLQISSREGAEPSWHRTAQRVHAAVGQFFGRRFLPNTRWAWAWDARGAVARAEGASQDARFQVVFDLALPPAWQAPVRIDTLVPDLVVSLPRHRWLRAPVETALPLGRCFLASARHDDRGRELVIRKPDGSGWRIELPQDAQPSAKALDRRGRVTGTALVRETELLPLCAAIERELVTSRLPRQARTILLDGTPITELPDTTLAPRAMLGELAPTVRAIRQRSQVPGELTLKRDIADGRREEIYISRVNLTASYADLPATHRRLLDDAGFGRGRSVGVGELAEPAPATFARGSSPTVSQLRHETQPLIAPAAPAAPAAPTAPTAPTSAPRAPVPTTAAPPAQHDARARRRREERTIPSLVVALPLRRLATS